MIQIKFKKLKKSDILQSNVQNRIEALIEKFDDLSGSKIQVTLEMENSPAQAGPDYFKVKVHVSGGRYHGVTVEKADINVYVALADVVDHLLEVLNRFGDRSRVLERKRARGIRCQVLNLATASHAQEEAG